MKHLGNLLLGIALMIAGAVIFLQNVTVNGFSLYRYNEVNVGAIIIILLAITFIAMLVKTNLLSILLFSGTALLFIITMILSIRLYVNKMTALTLILMIGLICIGIAFLIKGFIGISKNPA